MVDDGGSTVHTVDQNIVDSLHPTHGEAAGSGAGSVSSEGGGRNGGSDDDVPSVESLSENDTAGDQKSDNGTTAAGQKASADGPRSSSFTGNTGFAEFPSMGGSISATATQGASMPSAWERDTLNYGSSSNENIQKRTILRELQECAPEVVRRYGLSVNTSTLQTLQYELEQFHTKQQLDTQVKFLELGLMALCYGIEFVNKRALQGFLALDGWGDNTSKSLGQFRSCLRRIAIRYFTTRRETSEIMELGMLLLGHMAWYHFQNASRPVWESVNGNRSRRRRKTRSRRRSAATGGAADTKEGPTNEDGPAQDDESSSSESGDVDEDLEADQERTSLPEKPVVNLLGLLSQIVQ